MQFSVKFFNFRCVFLLLDSNRLDGRLGDSGSYTGSRTAPSGWFLCGFSIVGRLGQLHEEGQALGLRGRWAY